MPIFIKDFEKRIIFKIIDIFKQVKNFYNKYRKWLLILFVFCIPIILAMPFPMWPWNIEKHSAELQQGEPDSVINYQISTNVDALGASLLSALLGIKTESMPGYLCIYNNSEAYFDGEKLDPKGFLDGEAGGAISVPLIYNEITSMIYVPFASSTCKYFGNNKAVAELQNKIEVRGILPYGRPEVQMENGTTTIRVWQYSTSETIFKMDWKKGYEWRWLTYLKNFFLSLFAWIVVLSSIFQVWDNISKSKN